MSLEVVVLVALVAAGSAGEARPDVRPQIRPEVRPDIRADIGVRIVGACPSAAAFVKEARPLLPGRRLKVLPAGEPISPGGETLELASSPEGRTLLLRGPGGDVSRREPLPQDLGCEGLAREAAVLLAAWEFQGEAAPLAPAKSTAWSPPPATAVEAPSAAATLTGRSSPPALRAPAALRLGTALLASFVGDRASPSWGLLGEAQLGAWDGLALHLEVAALSEARLTVGDGQATWSRAWVGAGGLYALARGRWSLTVSADLLGGLFFVAGEGFNPNQRGTQRALGASSGLRLAWGGEAARLWLGPQLVLWPGRHTVLLAGSDLSRDLPSFEGSLCLGVDFLVSR